MSTYSDFYTSFDINPITGDLAVVTDQASIAQSIENLVQTNFYDRPFENTVGSNVLAQLFENPSPAQQQNLIKTINECIENFEPRAKILNVSTKLLLDQNALSVTITFQCMAIAQPQVVSFNLTRVR